MKKFAGKGGRKPQLDISINLIVLDYKNPRIVQYLKADANTTQFDLISVMINHFDTETISMSLAKNGYFDEEPIIVIPNDLPKDFLFSNYKNPDELAGAINKLIGSEEITFTVVEGNRRVSSIKLLLNSKLRTSLNINSFYPAVSDNDIIKDISTIPCIIYEKREDISSYLGVRHIAGLLKWEAFAKAVYISNTIDLEVSLGKTIDEAIKDIQESIADRSDKLKKQYVSYRLFQQAREELDFDVRPIMNKFSLLLVAYNSPAIREYIGVKKYSEVDFSSEMVSESKVEEFENILTWIFGNRNSNEIPILTDSRKITNTLSHIVKSESAVEYLLRHKDLDGAFERAGGEKTYLSKKINDAIKAITTSLGFAFKYKSDENLLKKVKELKELVNELEKMLTND